MRTLSIVHNFKEDKMTKFSKINCIELENNNNWIVKFK